jgi:D-alanyl-D-alanine carboxypeptidase
MMRLRWMGVALVVGTVVALSSAQSLAAHGEADGVRRSLNKVVASVKALGVPGGVIGVAGGPMGRYAKAFGVAGPGKHMRLEDHFRIGSVSKTFTATAILELVDRHRLRLDETIARWEPQLPNAKRITIRMLLAMRSGIWDEGGAGPSGRQSLLAKWTNQHCALRAAKPDCGRFWSPQAIINLAIKEGRAAYPPGVYYYSDTNYVLLGLIAQKVTHEPFGKLVHQLILKPLHMRQTSFPTRRLTLPTPATSGYVAFPRKAPKHYLPGTVPSPSTLFGAGNMVSTLHDLRIWARALATGALLEPATQRVRLDVIPIGGAFYPLKGSGFRSTLPVSYGLGIARAGNLLGHNGELDPFGYTAELWYLRSLRGSVVVLLNSITPCQYSTLSDALAATLSDVAFGPVASGAVSAPGFPGQSCFALASR